MSNPQSSQKKQRRPRKLGRCGKVFLLNISATDKAVVETLRAETSVTPHVIPPYNPEKIKGRVQRAVEELVEENRRAEAIRSIVHLYTEPSRAMLTQYFDLLRRRAGAQRREAIIDSYSDLLFRSLDADLMEKVRRRLCTDDSGDGGSRPSNGGSIMSRVERAPVRMLYTACEVCGNDTDFGTDKNEQMSCKVCFAVVDQLVDNRRNHHPLSALFTPVDRTAPFKEVIRRYQAQRNAVVGSEVISSVRSALEERGLSDMNVVTRQDVMRCLKDRGMQGEYKDAVLIHSLVTGRRVDSIHHLEEILLNNFCAVLDAFSEHYDSKEASGLEHLQFLLYLLLKHNGHPCTPEDFPSSSDFNSIDMSYDVYSVIFKKLGWEYSL